MITLGPIIGAIQNDTVRILIEFDQDGDQTISLLGKVTKMTKTVRVQANRPAIFAIDGLTQGTLYKIQYQNQDIGSFKTINYNDPSQLKFGVISCNSIKITKTLTEKKQLWRELQQRVEKQDLDFLLHIGDQLYVDYGYWEGEKDNCIGQIEKLCEGKPKEEWDVEQCREIIRNEYRQNWSYEPTKYVLSHVQSRMILDDHEILDDAGNKKELQDPNHWMGWYSEHVARYVYYEYQKQLVQDVNFDDFSDQTEEYQIWTEKNSGFFTFDCRGHLLWHGDYGKKDSYLGQKQKQAFLDCLKPDGQFKDKKSIFIQCSIPMILFSERITKAAKVSSDDMTQHWIYSNQKELIEILDALRNWKLQQEGRVVTLLAGDIHIGGHHDIYYNGQPLFKQLITSSMSNVVFTKFQGLVFEISSEIHENLGGGYTFEKHDFVLEHNNYGIVHVKDIEERGHTVNMGLVSTKNNKEERFWDNHTYQRQKGGGGCCNIF